MSTGSKPHSVEQRLALEGFYTERRIVELELDPVRGDFDAAHLREINRRIFQDLPGAGCADATPGHYRPPVSEGRDWMKQRHLATVNGVFYVAYSRMDAMAQAAMDAALWAAHPDKLRGLDAVVFTARIAQLYARVDYAHPFSDGNSRTLRTYTRQLARTAVGVLDWERFSNSPADRDALYIARDISANRIAQPQIQQEQTMRRVAASLAALSGYKDLPALLAS
jgi:cell filamentation protein